jgi:hypothetical protein
MGLRHEPRVNTTFDPTPLGGWRPSIHFDAIEVKGRIT